MGGWVDGWGHVKSLKSNENLDLMEIIQFYLKICDSWTHSHLLVGVCVVGWVSGWGHVKSLKIE